MSDHKKINYVVFPAKDIEAAKTFFTAVFGCSFVDYGPEYAVFSNAGLNGGFYKSDLASTMQSGGALNPSVNAFSNTEYLSLGQLIFFNHCF